jgi:hypothetical protein
VQLVAARRALAALLRPLARQPAEAGHLPEVELELAGRGGPVKSGP